jgi:hypothetical protein
MNNNRRIMMTIIIAFSTGFVLSAPQKQHPSISAQRSMRYTSRPANNAKVWQNNVRAKLFQLLKMDDLITNKNFISLNPKELSQADRGTYYVKEVEINSTASRRIRIIVTIPGTKHILVPAVVCIGGHGSNLYSPYGLKTIPREDSRAKSDAIYREFGTVLATMGYVTVSTTVSQHNVYEEDRLLMGERLWDLIRCVDYLQSMPEVDRGRIGCAGLSLGGEMAMWLGAMDERIAATVSAGFLTTMDHMEQNHCMCWKFDGLRELVDYADIYSLIAPRPLQCQNGLLEQPSQFYVPLARQAMEEVRTIYKDLDRPENVVLDVHEEGHVIDLPGLIYFFEKHLYQNRWKQETDDKRNTLVASIRRLINDVDPDRISRNLFYLAKDPLPYRKLNFTLPSHQKNTLYEADDYLAGKLEAWGYRVEREGVQVQAFRRDKTKPKHAQYSPPKPEDPWYTAYNLYAEKKGRSHPERIILIMAHKDSQSWIDSPGANDNAIGTVGVLEMAGVLAEYTTESTIRFLFCNEEHTPWTSKTAAQNSKSRGDNIVAVFNMDGIGVKTAEQTAAGKKTNVTAYTKPEGRHLADLMVEMNTRYSIGLEQRTAIRSSPGDDDGSFVLAGFPAAVINIGSWPYGDPNYHAEGDIPERCDIKNTAMTVQATLAAVVTLDQDL